MNNDTVPVGGMVPRVGFTLILRERELRPSAILELIDCLGDQEPHPRDKRIERLERLFVQLTGVEPEQFKETEGGAVASGTPVPPAQLNAGEVSCAETSVGPPR